jgi:hypothetical protein
MEEYARLKIDPARKEEIQQKLEEFISFCYGINST